MGIELPTPQGEAIVAPPASAEHAPVRAGAEQYSALQSAEVSTTERPSYQEVRHASGGGLSQNQTQQTVVSVTASPAAAPAPAPAPVSLDDVPVIAADDDLIEKQWVDSAKRIIKETRTDPYRQGEAISRLQTDYLQKRYGKTLADSEA